MEGTLGEIRMFAGDFAPKNWLYCQGQIMPIQQYSALFSILGTTYGGNGSTTFALPNFSGRVAVGPGQGPGLSNYVLGEVTGSENVTLLQSNLPQHNHAQMGSNNEPTTNAASGAALATNGRATNPPMPNIYTADGSNPVPLGLPTGIAGGGQPVSILQPVLGMNYVVCINGIYPSRN